MKIFRQFSLLLLAGTLAVSPELASLPVLAAESTITDDFSWMPEELEKGAIGFYEDLGIPFLRKPLICCAQDGRGRRHLEQSPTNFMETIRRTPPIC